jgi:hypothetical protein
MLTWERVERATVVAYGLYLAVQVGIWAVHGFPVQP